MSSKSKKSTQNNVVETLKTTSNDEIKDIKPNLANVPTSEYNYTRDTVESLPFSMYIVDPVLDEGTLEIEYPVTKLGVYNLKNYTNLVLLDVSNYEHVTNINTKLDNFETDLKIEHHTVDLKTQKELEYENILEPHINEEYLYRGMTEKHVGSDRFLIYNMETDTIISDNLNTLGKDEYYNIYLEGDICRSDNKTVNRYHEYKNKDYIFLGSDYFGLFIHLPTNTILEVDKPPVHVIDNIFRADNTIIQYKNNEFKEFEINKDIEYESTELFNGREEYTTPKTDLRELNVFDEHRLIKELIHKYEFINSQKKIADLFNLKVSKHDLKFQHKLEKYDITEDEFYKYIDEEEYICEYFENNNLIQHNNILFNQYEMVFETYHAGDMKTLSDRLTENEDNNYEEIEEVVEDEFEEQISVNYNEKKTILKELGISDEEVLVKTVDFEYVARKINEPDLNTPKTDLREHMKDDMVEDEYERIKSIGA